MPLKAAHQAIALLRSNALSSMLIPATTLSAPLRDARSVAPATTPATDDECRFNVVRLAGGWIIVATRGGIDWPLAGTYVSRASAIFAVDEVGTRWLSAMKPNSR